MALSTSRGVRRGSEEGKKMRKELSEDLIVEILARLPVKPLMRFKCVSKLWYNLILSPNFIALHTTHNHNKNQVNLSLRICERDYTVATNPTITVSFRFGDVSDTEKLTFSDVSSLDLPEIVGCFNGVVCLNLSKSPQKYALCNPATRQVRETGNSPMEGPLLSDTISFRGEWYGSGFCFDQVTTAFKVAQIKLTVSKAAETSAQVNVFSTATNSWTKKNVGVPFRTQGMRGRSLIRGATVVNGYMHWHIAIFDHGAAVLEDMYILSYNMIDEVFKRIEMPCRPVLIGYHLAAYKGSLAIFVPNTSYTEVDAWVMKDCSGSNQSWPKLLTCRPSFKVERAFGFFRKDDADLVLLYGEGYNSQYLYDPENRTTKKIGPMRETFLYSESLASLN